MELQLQEMHLGAVVVLQSEVYQDERGFFSEVFRADQFAHLGLPTSFVQDNHSGSVKGVVRGLHFQWEPPMGKLMRVTAGEAFLVAVDIRKNSPTLGQWFGLRTKARDGLQVWAPAGFARGFCVLSDWAEIQYKCTGIYNQKAESGVLWDDPAIGIEWPVNNPILSAKDASAQPLAEWIEKPEANYFTYSCDK